MSWPGSQPSPSGSGLAWPSAPNRPQWAQGRNPYAVSLPNPFKDLVPAPQGRRLSSRKEANLRKAKWVLCVGHDMRASLRGAAMAACAVAQHCRCSSRCGLVCRSVDAGRAASRCRGPPSTAHAHAPPCMPCHGWMDGLAVQVWRGHGAGILRRLPLQAPAAAHPSGRHVHQPCARCGHLHTQ